jgi:UDP-N-acetylglucosamine 1-carboxyvinyltransferase
MGATVKEKGNQYEVVANGGRLKGAEIFFRNQTVTGTETMMMAATLAKGKTVIKNAAMEPEIVWLSELLNRSGAKIVGAGTSTITIDGVSALSSDGGEWGVMPDRIEAGSFILLGAVAGKKLEVTNCDPTHLESLIETLRTSGTDIIVKKDSVLISAPKKGRILRGVSIKTHEYPGFPTDLQAPMMIYLTQTEGESLVFETIFEGRLNYTESLSQMGANITMMDPHRVLVRGPASLKGRKLESPDLRAGLAFVMAAIIARGNSEIHNVYNIDRGYEAVEERLRAIGVAITRVG